jgi:hypothetical protein
MAYSPWSTASRDDDEVAAWARLGLEQRMAIA